MAELPTTPESASKWLGVLKAANDMNIIPIILAIAVGWMYWTNVTQTRLDLQAAEQRTRAALQSCREDVQAQGSRTREEVRTQSKAVQTAVGAGPASPAAPAVVP